MHSHLSFVPCSCSLFFAIVLLVLPPACRVHPTYAFQAEGEKRKERKAPKQATRRSRGGISGVKASCKVLLASSGVGLEPSVVD